jgi:hypothetical protein
MPEVRQLQIRMLHKTKSPCILALRTLRTERQTNVDDWMILLACLCSMRKRKFDWAPTVNRSPSQTIKSWLQKTPILNDWIASDRCLVSPTVWPGALYPAFTPRIIPSPYEVANVDMNGRFITSERAFKNHLVLLLYCMGFTVHDIAEGYDYSERDVLRLMYSAVENLHDLPSYVVWASGTDFTRCMIPPSPRQVSLEKRGEFISTLQKNPFYVDKKLLDQFISSPPYLSYLLYSSPKRMRLTTGCRIYRTSEATNESKKQE